METNHVELVTYEEQLKPATDANYERLCQVFRFAVSHEQLEKYAVGCSCNDGPPPDGGR